MYIKPLQLLHNLLDISPVGSASLFASSQRLDSPYPSFQFLPPLLSPKSLIFHVWNKERESRGARLAIINSNQYIRKKIYILISVDPLAFTCVFCALTSYLRPMRERFLWFSMSGEDLTGLKGTGPEEKEDKKRKRTRKRRHYKFTSGEPCKIHCFLKIWLWTDGPTNRHPTDGHIPSYRNVYGRI